MKKHDILQIADIIDVLDADVIVDGGCIEWDFGLYVEDTENHFIKADRAYLQTLAGIPNKIVKEIMKEFKLAVKIKIVPSPNVNGVEEFEKLPMLKESEKKELELASLKKQKLSENRKNNDRENRM